MASDLTKFIDFLNFYKNIDSDYPIYDTITNISKDNNSRPLIESDFKIVSLDNFCLYSYKSKNLPSTTDALVLIKEIKLNGKILFKLYFIEFKGFDLDFACNKGLFEDFINNFKGQTCFSYDDGCYIKDNFFILNELYNTYEDERFSYLKLKPLESIFIVLPKIYEDYCEENNIVGEEKINNFSSFLTDNIYTELIIVGKNFKNLSNSHVYYRGCLSLKLRGKYSHYVPNVFNTYHIWNEDQFRENLLGNIEEFSL